MSQPIENRVQLDWRRLPSQDDVLAALRGLLDCIDGQGVLCKDKSDTHVGSVYDTLDTPANPYERTPESYMVVRWNRQIRKTLQTDMVSESHLK